MPDGPSLDDSLCSTPNLVSNVFDILLRFRLNFIAILAYIEQVFSNVKI